MYQSEPTNNPGFSNWQNRRNGEMIRMLLKHPNYSTFCNIAPENVSGVRLINRKLLLSVSRAPEIDLYVLISKGWNIDRVDSSTAHLSRLISSL